jgi:hypothetical protein
MTRYWAAALILAVVAMLLLMRRMARRRDPSAEDRALVPHGDGERELVEFDPLLRGEAVSDRGIDDPGDLDDTAPAVLSPPEWTEPKSVSNGTRR